MKVFAILFLVWLALTESTLSEGDSSVASSITDNSSQHVRLRRSLASKKARTCYKGPFVGRRPPTGFRANQKYIRFICQQAPGDQNYMYSTEFDLSRGIPIYSAYRVNQKEATKFGKYARPSGNIWEQQSDRDFTKQGSDVMYASNTINIQKGHLVPCGTFSFTKENILSTFMYTNAVPQYQAFNGGQWGRYEDKVRSYATSVCSAKKGDLYLLTGSSEVKIGTTVTVPAMAVFSSKVTAAERITIPNSMWTAGCCIQPDGTVVGNFAFIGNNVQAKNQILMSQMTVPQLEALLHTGVGTSGGAAIDLFPGKPGCSAAAKNVKI